MQIPKVLLVNDDAASLFALETLLTSGGGSVGDAAAGGAHAFEVMTATSGNEALRMVLNHEFAVILLDVNMPGMDGFETAEAIHSHPRSATVPIIFITAHYADEMHRLKGYQSGAADYIFTPVIPQVLLTKVAVFVDLTRKNLELRAKTDELSRLYQDLRVQRMQDLERINAELEQEVAERKLAEERAHELSIRDPLTGLVNRRSLIQQLEHAVASADRQQGEFALLFLDLDKFKQINDTLGHESGDELLRQVSARLLAAVRVSDVVARLGGDEFVVLLDGPGAAANAARVARKIARAHDLAFDIRGSRVRTSTSIGIALYPQDADGATALMKNADCAMYHAKNRKRGSIEFFREELNARETERTLWARELKEALEGDQFELRFQPAGAVAGGALTGVDAQLWWNHPRLGTVAAEQFLTDVLDRTLLDQVDEWTIQAACAQAARWRGSALPLPALPVTVVIHAPAIDAGLAERTLAAIEERGLPRGALQLAFGQRQLGAQREPQPALERLHEAGVLLGIDDFGSSGPRLDLLRTLPFDALRIERSLVGAVGTPGGTDMLAALVHLARALGLRVLAQGVDTQEQMAALATVGCDEYQGELLSGALSPAAMLALLEKAASTVESATQSETRRVQARDNLTTPKKRGTSR